jgi:hypothetical protein
MRFPALPTFCCTLAMLTLGAPAFAEVWDKELTEADFVALDDRCGRDAQVISEIVGGFSAPEAFRNREVATVTRIRTAIVNGECYEFRGVCLFDAAQSANAPRSAFYDEGRVSFWQCLSPLAGQADWKVVKSIGTAYELGLNLRVE